NDGTGGAQVSSAIMTLKNRQVVEDVIHFRKIVLSPDWNNNVLPRFYVSTSKSIIKALINMHSFEIQLSPIG
ncbi:hypothetical protein RCD80_28250, partial [Klebsiella variicola subsp. variicola]|uniref:hypothetical protein n=1 Tax=Klebsiella variicola TaxID=244366 RepID=UPI0027DF5508